jgi:Family of unknown function (DUF6498)
MPPAFWGGRTARPKQPRAASWRISGPGTSLTRMAALRTFAPGSPLADRSLHGILLGNLVTLAAGIANGWSAAPLLWIFWGQSVVIGIANVVRMMRLEQFSTEGFRSGGRRVPETKAAKIQTAVFFAFHYGFFHLVYFVFLAQGVVGGKLGPNDWLGVGVSVLAFTLAHGYSLWWNEARDFKDKKPNLGTLMFYPYLRILPMHLTIIIGSTATSLALPLFIGLKTLSDCGMHLVEHAIFRRGGLADLRKQRSRERSMAGPETSSRRGTPID